MTFSKRSSILSIFMRTAVTPHKRVVFRFPDMENRNGHDADIAALPPTILQSNVSVTRKLGTTIHQHSMQSLAWWAMCRDRRVA